MIRVGLAALVVLGLVVVPAGPALAGPANAGSANSGSAYAGTVTSASVTEAGSACRAVGTGQHSTGHTITGAVERTGDTIEVHLSRNWSTNHSFRLVIPGQANLTVVERSGLVESEVGYVWPGNRSRVSLVYKTDASPRFLIRDEWAYVPLPISLHYPVDYSLTNDTSGYLSRRGSSAYLGSYETYRLNDSTRFEKLTIVVASKSASAGDFANITADMRRFARGFDVGAPPTESQVIFVIPQIPSLGLGGYHSLTGEAVVSTANRVWRQALFHEYVHARLGLTLGLNMTWLREGAAQYYGWKAEPTGEREFMDDYLRVEYYKMANDNTAVLANQSTWHKLTPYSQGMMVMLALDEKIRRATDGRKSLIDVIRKVNGDECLSYAEFKGYVHTVSGKNMSGWLDEHVRERNVPDSARPSIVTRTKVFAFTNPGGTGVALLALSALVGIGIWWWRQ